MTGHVNIYIFVKINLLKVGLKMKDVRPTNRTSTFLSELSRHVDGGPPIIYIFLGALAVA